MNAEFNLAELYPLIAEGIKAGGTYRFYPKGKSMLPLLKEGADSVVLSSADTLAEGDVVLYKRQNGMFVIHRIIKISDTISMCGDNQFYIEKDILKEQVLAKVSAIYKKERLVKLDSKKYAFYVKALPLRRFWLKNLFRINNMFRKIFKGR